MTSQAFAGLMARVAEVDVLNQFDPARQGFSDALRSNALSRASLVLLSAHLEGYLEDLMVEALDVMSGSGINVERLPLSLRAMHAEAHLAEIEEMRDKNRRAHRIQKLFASESPLWASGTTVTSKLLRPKIVCAEMSNPGSKEISSFLSIIGVDLRAYMQRLSALDLLERINGLIARRNQIAHGDAMATATHGDVEDYKILVMALSKHIDAAVAQRLMGIMQVSALPW